MPNPRNKLLLTVLVFAVMTLVAPQANAAPQTGITVSPANLEVTFRHDETQKNLPITITNTYGVAVKLVADFRGIDENAGLLLPTGQTDASLATNLHLSQTDIAIPAHSALQLQLAVTNGASLTPGGHYATLLLTQQTGSKLVSNLRASLSLSLFVIRADGAAANLQLESAHLNGWLLAAPTKATVNFKNTGNVHAVPHGVITIFNGRGDLLAKGIINVASRPLLPGKVLGETLPIQSLNSTWRPQHINVTVQYQTGRADETLQMSFKRWYVPPIFVLSILAFGFVLALSIKLGIRLKIVKRSRKLGNVVIAKFKPHPHFSPPNSDTEPHMVTVKIIKPNLKASITNRPKTKPRKTTKPAAKKPKKSRSKPSTKSKS